jgi:hypothetical protein
MSEMLMQTVYDLYIHFDRFHLNLNEDHLKRYDMFLIVLLHYLYFPLISKK